MSFSIVESGKLLVVSALLAYSSWADFRRREVDDWVWILFGGSSLLLNLAMLGEILHNPATAYALALDLVLPLGLYWLGAFGGADAKCLVCLGIAYPIIPLGAPVFAVNSTMITVPVATLNNGLLLTLAYLPTNMLLNVKDACRGVPFVDANGVSPLKQLLFFVLLRRMKVFELLESEDSFQFVAENLRDAPLSSFLSPPSMPEQFRNSPACSDRLVYAQFLLPFQGFLLGGYLLALLFGDLLLSTPYLLLGL